MPATSYSQTPIYGTHHAPAVKYGLIVCVSGLMTGLTSSDSPSSHCSVAFLWHIKHNSSAAIFLAASSPHANLVPRSVSAFEPSAKCMLPYAWHAY